MIPRNIILPKVNNRPAEFLAPERNTINSLFDTAIGGIALNDPSKGRSYQLWQAEYVNNEIVIKPENSNTIAFTLPAPGALTLSLAFDNNMGLAVAWQTATESKLYHYQTTVAAFGIKTVVGTSSCKVAIDKPENYFSNRSDVIFAYTKNGALYYTVQRERYEEEHLCGNTNGKIIRIGLNEDNRFQMECG